jgi:hypothetical protein
MIKKLIPYAMTDLIDDLLSRDERLLRDARARPVHGIQLPFGVSRLARWFLN